VNDGVVKYDFVYQRSKALPQRLIKPVESCRSRLYALGLIGVYENGIGYGNISRRVEGEQFVITGTQTGHLSRLTPKHYALVEACDARQFSLCASGAAKPSSEALTHGTVYALTPQIQAVIHIHSMALWKFMLAGDYLHTADVEYGSIEMIDEVNRLYAALYPLANPLFAMAGHEEGIICFGRGMDEAEQTLYGLIRDYLSSEGSI